MHGERGVDDDGAAGDEEGRFAGGTATQGQDGVADGLAVVLRDDGVEAEGW